MRANAVRIYLFMIATSLGWATTTVQQIQASAQQARIWVRTDQDGPCTYAISAATGLSPVVDDNNTTLFAGANSDARAGSIITSRDHYYIAGERTGAVASDGLIHSRSLAANTLYFGSVTCGSNSAVTFTFTT